MPSGGAAAFLTVIWSAVALSACGGDDGGGDRGGDPRPVREPELAEGGAVRSARCSGAVPGCRAATGRIVYVERVDPDGDGDAHLIILDPPGITLPGLTAIDVRRGLRPDPLPGVGDLVSAAGPVQEGSYGQRQIHALELHVAGGSR